MMPARKGVVAQPRQLLLLLVVMVMAMAAAETHKAAVDCNKAWYTYDSFVCVCDATHCDDLSAVDDSLPSAGEYTTIRSTRDEDRFVATIGNVEGEGTSSNIITVTTTETFQTILGFGGAFTDAAGLNLNALSEETREFAVRSYFGDAGVGYNLCRIPIAGSDCSTRPYSYDDVEGDVALENWSLQPEDYDYKLPYLKRAMELSSEEILFFGSPWSPPAWMKSNGMFNGSGVLLPEYWQPWSEYIVKFVEAYEAEGVPLWGLTPQNEPLSGFEDWHWNTCGWSAEDMRDWIKTNLGPTLEAAGMRRLKMMVHDFNRDTLVDYVTPMLEDADSNQYIDGVAVHWYADTGVGPGVLQQTHDLDPSKFLLYTEACEGYNVEGEGSVMLGSWVRGEHYFSNIIEDLNNWSTGWVDWNLALDLEGGPNWAYNMLDAPIIVNATGDVFYKQPTFYALAHISKFVERGGVRVGVQVEVAGVEATAIVNPDGEVVVLALNRLDTDIDDVTIAIDGVRFLNTALPAYSFQTFVVGAE